MKRNFVQQPDSASGRGQRARDRAEQGGEAVAHGRQGADGRHRDQGRDQAILNGRRAVLILDEPDQLTNHTNLHRWRRRRDHLSQTLTSG